VTSTVLTYYLLGWLTTTIGFVFVVGKLNDRLAPAPHPIPLAVVAGAAWPLVLLGAAQFTAVAVVLDAIRRRTDDRHPAATVEFDELLAATA
jgi:hypothetical protein